MFTPAIHHVLFADLHRRGFCFKNEDDSGGGNDDKGDKGKDDKSKSNKDDKGGAGGSGNNPPPATLTITADELARREESARAAERQRIADENRAKVDEAEREKKKQQGEFQTLAADAEKERDAARLEARTLKVKDRLRDYLDENHKQYAPAVKWILPAIRFDLKTSDADIDKAIKETVEAYVKDVAREPEGVRPPGSFNKHLPRDQQTPDKTNKAKPDKPDDGSGDTAQKFIARRFAFVNNAFAPKNGNGSN